MVSWIENTDFEVDKKKQNLATCGEKTSDLRSYVEGINIIFVFQNHPEGQLMKETSRWGFPKLLQAV